MSRLNWIGFQASFWTIEGYIWYAPPMERFMSRQLGPVLMGHAATNI
jgi:hypothetical protein